MLKSATQTLREQSSHILLVDVETRQSADRIWYRIQQTPARLQRCQRKCHGSYLAMFNLFDMDELKHSSSDGQSIEGLAERRPNVDFWQRSMQQDNILVWPTTSCQLASAQTAMAVAVTHPSRAAIDSGRSWWC